MADAPHGSERRAHPKVRRTFLVVDDNAAVLSLVRRFLEAEGHHVFCASGGEEALAAMQGRAEGFDLLITDVVMPGMQGPEVARALRRPHPALKVLFMSGHLAEALPQLESIAEASWIAKPFSRDQLLDKITSLLQHGSRAGES